MSMGPLLTPELREMLVANDVAGLREFCEALHPATAAEFAGELSPAEIWQVLSHIDAKRRAAIFEYFAPARQHELIMAAEQSRLARLIEAMEPDDRVDVLKSLDD
jgi:magnesium transporter